MTPGDSQPDKQITQNQRITLPVMVPLFSSILVLLAIFSLAIYNLKQQQISNDASKQINNTCRTFHQLLAADARLLAATTEFIENDPNIQNAWLAKDRPALLHYTAPLLVKFRNDYGVTHLYFIDINNTCFLRVHNPVRYDDRLDRFTLQSALRTGKPAWGIELGPNGTFTLRRVQPWFVKNSPAGFIELGEEIEKITLKLKEMLDVDLVVLINKSLLDRRSWQEGQTMMGRIGDWDRLSDSVIAYSTTPVIPPDFITSTDQARHKHKDRLFSSKLNGLSYRGGFFRLLDAGGREVGDILVIKNVSKDYASLHALLAIVTTLCFLIASTLVLFFYFHINAIEKRLVETHNSLSAEIEKRKAAESELRANRNNLANIVKKRTVELEKSKRQLQQEVNQRIKAEKSLEKLNTDLKATVSRLIRSNRQLRQFAHLTAHDLKTPLRGIGTLAQWLLTDYYDKFDDNGRKHLNLLVKRIQRIDKIINVILQYSTIARIKHNERLVDSNGPLGEAILQVQPPPNIKITVQKRLPTVICNEKHINLVFYNLIDNAVKFMNKPEGHIIIDCSEEKNHWTFSVSDNGPGIEKQHFDRIFHLFQTLDDDDDVPGMGVGLSITKKIIELYDGKIWLTSEPGRGSTFFFTLPKQKIEIKNAKLQASIIG
ncbi:MAG: GHKL domain-containing protein [Sedimentisphaerales bacterium]|nr:GHKL domain-containing protein [Sedimentisphaerales bacterium]